MVRICPRPGSRRRAVGDRLGSISYVLTSAVPRAVETAIAMGGPAGTGGAWVMLSEQVRAEFEERGFVYLRGAFAHTWALSRVAFWPSGSMLQVTPSLTVMVIPHQR